MAEVAIIGGGLAGLTAGYFLKQQDVDFALFEAEERAGGKVRTEGRDGYLLEAGPHTLHGRHEVLDQIIRELSLGSRVQEASPEVKKRYIVRGGRPVAVPSGPVSLAKTPLLSPRAKMRLLQEPFVPPGNGDESVAQFVERRLGREVLDFLVDPLVAGVYAGNPSDLSVREAFPKLWALENEYRGLFQGMIRKVIGRRTHRRRMFSFEGGMQTLPNAIAKSFEDNIRLKAAVRKIIRDGERWRILLDDREESFKAIICAVPLHAMPLDLSLDEVKYPPVAVVSLAYPRERVARPLDGFGVLVPSIEKQFRILGALFTSTLFPDRAPKGHALFTTFLAGSRAPHIADLPASRLYELAHDDLARLFDISETPIFRHHFLWPEAIPQYNLGYKNILERLDHYEQAHPGIYFAGNYRNGIAVGDAMQSGRMAALRVLSEIDV